MAFSRESEDDDSTGTIDILGRSYTLSIRTGYEWEELDEIAARATNWFESHWQEILDRITTDLLPMHNEEWSDDDAPLDKDWFVQTLGAPDVNVWEDEAYMLYFPDGNLFGGHFIEVLIESPEFGREVSVGIVG